MSKVPVRAVETSLQILHRLERDGTASVTGLARDLDRPKATVYYHVKTLEKHGYVVRSDGDCALGLRALELGGRARDRHGLTRSVGPSVRRLASEANETAVFAVPERDSAVVLELAYPAEPAAEVDVTVGSHLPLHCSATGKAILAAMGEERLSAAVDRCDLSADGPGSIDSESELHAERRTVRTDGHAFDRGDRDSEVNGVASSVLDEDGSVVGAIGLLGPASRLYSDRFEHELPHLVERFANHAEHALRS